MDYNQTIEWMFVQLPMYQLQGASAYKKDLTNTVLLADHIGNPQNNFKSVHIAGTNGKGSTSSMLASVLQEAGYKVGLYTSPHLKDFRERIKINGEFISKEFVVDFIAKHKLFLEQHSLSFFEMSVGLAFDYFAKEKVDIAIIEVGLGGRLDSTNIITPLVSVITNIGFDHVQFLGNSIAAIASEKAGIIKTGIPAVIGEYTVASKTVFMQKAQEMNAELFFAADLINEEWPSDLLGDYQFHNKKTVIQTVQILKKYFEIKEEHVKNGLLNVMKNTGLMGRWQQLRSNPKVICDTAHNSHGLKLVLHQIQKESFQRLFIVLGVVNDKDLADILPLFPKKAHYFLCKPDLPRGLEVEKLKQALDTYGLTNNLVFNSVSEAYQEALKQSNPNDFIYIGGSTFVVAEII